MGSTKRFVKLDWLELALVLLGKEGPESMTVERLCAAAGRTRGSLYHHFGDHKSFLHEVVLHWQETCTAKIIETVGKPDEKSIAALEHLNKLAQTLDFDVEVNIRRLATIHPSLQDLISGVDQTRIRFIAEHYERIENRITIEAQMVAELEYAIFIGVQHIDSGVLKTNPNTLYSAFSELLAPRGKKNN